MLYVDMFNVCVYIYSIHICGISINSSMKYTIDRCDLGDVYSVLGINMSINVPLIYNSIQNAKG